MIYFESLKYSLSGEEYKIQLFSETYGGIYAAIIGGGSKTFWVQNDWTDYLQNGQSVLIDGASDTVVSFTYNEAQNRTQITVSTTTYTSQTEFVNDIVSGGYEPIFAPKVLDFNTEWENESDNILESLKASSTTITYSNNDVWFDRFMESYIESDDNELKIIIYKNDELEWVGNIVIDLVEWDNTSKPIPFTIKAIDGINKLKDIPYTNIEGSNSNTRLKEHIFNLLEINDLSQFWDVNDPYIRESIEYVSNEVTGTITDVVSPLDYCYITDSMFVNKLPNADLEGMSCYDALRGIIELFNCRMFISQGCYYIQQVRNYDSATVIVYREYTKAVSSYARSTYSYKLTAGDSTRGEDLVVMGGGKFGYLFGLFRANMEVKANLQSEAKLPILLNESGINPDSYTETFEVFGGSGSGATMTFVFEVMTSVNLPSGDYAYLKLEMYGVSSGITYYLSGGLGTPLQWASIPYSKLYYDWKVSGITAGQTVILSVTTPEIPFDGTLTVVFTLTHYDYTNSIKIITQPTYFTLYNKLTLPIGGQSDNTLVYANNPANNYTKALDLPPLIITDFSNATSVNVISVSENYLSANNKLVKSETWDAGFDADYTLTETRVLEAISLQFRPVSKYMGGFEGQYYPHQCIVYDNKTYFFNGINKKYVYDETEGTWLENINKKTSIVVTNWAGTVGDKEKVPEWGGQSALVAIVGNTNKITSIAADASAGTITNLTVLASGLTTSVGLGDTVIIVDPVSNQIVETFTLSSALGSSDTTMYVNSKETDIDIKEGMIVQMSRETYFSKLTT